MTPVAFCKTNNRNTFAICCVADLFKIYQDNPPSTFLGLLSKVMRWDMAPRTRLWVGVDDLVVQMKPSERIQIWCDTCHQHLGSLHWQDKLLNSATTQCSPILWKCLSQKSTFCTHAFNPQCFPFYLTLLPPRCSGKNFSKRNSLRCRNVHPSMRI